MSLIIGENQREPWSRVTDSRILRPGDELRLVAPGFMAIIGVLDSHDPRATTRRQEDLPDHHHILVQVEGEDQVWSAGMWVQTGEPEELIFLHYPSVLEGDPVTMDNLARLRTVLNLGSHGLYFASDQEQLSVTRQGQAYVDSAGRLLR